MTMTTQNNGYPLFNSTFYDFTDYGFDTQSLITSFLSDEHKPSTHPTQHWQCNQAYCLYNNKTAKHKNTLSQPTKCSEYPQSNPIDIIHTPSSDFICHSAGSNQHLLRICPWKHKNKKLKNGYTLNLTHQIEGISHCNNQFNNNETVILCWNRYKAFHVGLQYPNTQQQNEYKFDVIEAFVPPSNSTFQSGIICPLPFVWNSGLEDTVFFTSNGTLICYRNKLKHKYSEINLKFKATPPWTELIWTEHPRIIRLSTDMELMTIDFRTNHKIKKVKIAQKHLYFDPICAVNGYKHYITTVGFQGLALFDDRMLKRPCSKWRFYDFDCCASDGQYSRLQVYNLNNAQNEYWIICSGRGQRICVFPFFANGNGPIVSKMPFNINKYVACFGPDAQINSVLAVEHEQKHHIIATNEYGAMLCTEFELQKNETFDERKYNIFENEMIENENVNDNMHLIELQNALNPKQRIKSTVVYNEWSERIKDLILSDTKYTNEIHQSKKYHFCREFEKYSDEIRKFTQIPKNIEEIRHEFEGKFTKDLDGLTLFDYFDVFKESDLGLHAFEIESISNIHQIGDDAEDEQTLNVIITYFVSKRLDERNYLNIESEHKIQSEDECDEKDDEKMEVAEEEIVTTTKNEKDELDLNEFFALSQMAATQESEPATDEIAQVYNQDDNNAGSGCLDGGNQNVNGDNDGRLFETESEIKERCQELMESLCNKWIKGEDQYVIGDWRITNGNNVEYDGMIQKRGTAPKHMRRAVKRVWS